jgi:hypothetical protein
MLDFPASPTNGQIFAGANGVLYQWNAAGGLWLTYGTGTNNAIINATPPANPVAGQMWWSPDLGRLFIYYNDGNSSQWVPATVGPNAPTPALGDFFATSTAATPAATQTIIFPTVVSGNSGGWYSTSTGRFTPPAGRYRIQACLGGSMSTGSPGSQQCVLRKNGTALVTGSSTVAGNFFWAQAFVDGEYDANGSDWFDVQCGGTAWDRTPALSWFMAFPVAASAVSVASQGFRQLGRIVPVAGQAVIDFQSIPADINDLEMRFDVTPATNNGNLLLRFFDAAGAIDANANYGHGNFHSNHAAAAGSNVFFYGATSGATGIMLNLFSTNWGLSTAQPGQGRVCITNIRDTARRKTITSEIIYTESTNSYVGYERGFGRRDVVGAITGLRLLFDNGNFAAGGAVTLYGSP